jgi:hypothetical protein
MKKTNRPFVIFLTLLAASVLAFNANAARKQKRSTQRAASNAQLSVTVPSVLPNCTAPGITVLTDPTGDAKLEGVADSEPGDDAQSLSVAEPANIGAGKMLFTLKVASLNSLPPDRYWSVMFNVGATTYTARMSTVPPGTPAAPVFEYFQGAYNTVGLTTPADPSSSYDPDGTIRIVVPRNGVGSPAIGSTLTFLVRVAVFGGGLFIPADNMPDSQLFSGIYTVVGSETCGGITVTSPTYIKGGMTFSPSYTTRAPYIGQDVEPSTRCDKFGNCYVAAIRGVPGGTDLWYFDLRPTVNGAPNPNYDPFMRNPIYRGQPDSITGMQDASVGGDGGGDVDIAVGLNPEATENVATPPTLAYSSLAVANLSSQRSTDRGATFTKNPAGNLTGGIPADDRQWMEFYGKDSVYMLYRLGSPLAVGVIAFVQRSDDGGLTYGPASEVGNVGQVGGIAVDQNDGTVYVAGSTGTVAVGTPVSQTMPPITYTFHNVAGSGNAHLFFTVKVAPDSTVYVCYSNDHDVFVRYSTDHGQNWSQPIRVSDGPETKTAVFPWIQPSSVPGTIGVVWYGSTKDSTGDDSADWNVFYALGTNVTTNPVFQQVKATDHVIHGANISESGLVVNGQSPNRNLADYFQVAFDPTGAVVIGYADDHNDLSGHTYVTRQISGPNATGGTVPAPVEGSALPPKVFQPLPTAESVGGIPGSQVTDFARDVRTGGNPQAGGTVVLPENDPLDILSILYSVEGTPAAPVLVSTMKVSDMTAIPPSSNWRMTFTANAPDSVLSPYGEYTFGVSDRGDQFFVRAATDASGAQTFFYGTATRNFDASITYTDKGTADSGAFDIANKTLTIKVAVSKLNAALAPSRPQLVLGSILTGLRGSTFTTAQGSGNNRADTARGGTQFPISFPIQLASAASVKTHGAAGTFGVDLPLTGSPGIECRTGGTNGDYTIVFTFAQTLGDVTGASVTSGTGRVTSSMIGADAHQYIVNLTGVTNEQTITVSLHNVTGPPGTFSSIVSVRMGVLEGDTTDNRAVNASDVSQTQSQSGQTLTNDNFRTDVTVNGSINSADISFVQSRSGTGLP